MKLPTYVKKKKAFKLKICQEANCMKEFFGHPIAKYCALHNDPRNRVKKRRVFEDPSFRNKIFKHSFTEEKKIEFNCSLNGCDNKYMLLVHPKTYIYPKYCDMHRNEFKRILHVREAKQAA